MYYKLILLHEILLKLNRIVLSRKFVFITQNKIVAFKLELNSRLRFTALKADLKDFSTLETSNKRGSLSQTKTSLLTTPYVTIIRTTLRWYDFDKV